MTRGCVIRFRDLERSAGAGAELPGREPRLCDGEKPGFHSKQTEVREGAAIDPLTARWSVDDRRSGIDLVFFAVATVGAFVSEAKSPRKTRPQNGQVRRDEFF